VRTTKTRRHEENKSFVASGLRGSIGIITAVLLAAAAVFGVARNRGPTLPQLPDPSTLAPDVQQAARDSLADVAADRRDGARWGRFAMTCEANGLLAMARDAYAAATAVDDANAKWWYRLAATEARLGRPDAAVADIERAIDRDPGYAPSHWRLGFWLLDRGDAGGAEREFARAAAIDPKDRSAIAGLARVYLLRREEARAIDLLERTLAKNPSDAYLLQLLGTAYRRVGRDEEAAFALAVGAAGEPAWADPWTDEMLAFRRGFAVRLKDATAYFMAGQMERAIALLEQLQQERPGDVALLSHLGEVYVAAGRVDAGITALERVVSASPDRFEAWVNLASGYTKKGDLQRARAAIDRAIAIEPTLGRAHEGRGLILWRGGDERGALDAFLTAVRHDPRDTRALVYAGMLQMNLARPADAAATFARATRIDPTRVDAWVGVANAAMATRALDRASAALDHAAHLNGEDPGVKQASERLRAMRAGAGSRE
jgi:tetratricopeptide (TPR) repeat protein